MTNTRGFRSFEKGQDVLARNLRDGPKWLPGRDTGQEGSSVIWGNYAPILYTQDYIIIMHLFPVAIIFTDTDYVYTFCKNHMHLFASSWNMPEERGKAVLYSLK